MKTLTNNPNPAIVPHPQGGWTIARPVNSGTARVYDGQYLTRTAAQAALIPSTKAAA